jgi:two-component system response regulator (stage 0 sporulation protein F)
VAQTLKILIVDDEDPIRTILKNELSDHGFDVAEADGGQAALEKMNASKPDLVILDVRMPGMDGLQVLKAIREKNLANKVIMLTAVDELKVARESVELGANDFMTKPFQFKNMYACIDRVMKEK